MDKSLANAIHRSSYLTGQFTLRSGATSTYYFDKYQFEADPSLLKQICEAMIKTLPNGEFLAGVELGGIPIATLLSQLTGRPALFVRKQAKTYGTAKLAEGQAFERKTLVLVEDVVSSGGQLLETTTELRARGAIITDAVCVIDRESGGTESLASAGVKLTPLFRSSDLTQG